MKGFFKSLVVFAVILLLSAFLAPIFYEFFQKFHPYKFERIFQRIVMIGSLLAAVLFVRIRKDTLARYGLMWEPRSLGLLAKGFLMGISALCILAGIRLSYGQAVWRPDQLSAGVWAAKIAAALGTGLLIGLMEEFFFRGFVFRSLLKTLKGKLVVSVLITTALYSIVHFIGMKKIFVDSTPTFIDGIRMIGAPFVSLAMWPKFWPEAVGLFFFGLALFAAVWRTGSLYISIGLHAGCVFFVRMDDLFIKTQVKRSLLFGSKILYDGLLGWFVLIVLTAALWEFSKPARTVTPETNA
jgi:membrane protease YdiL (CAAX protease family)